MRDKSSEIRVGVVVIVSLLIVVIAVLWGKEFSLTTRQQTLHIVFSNCSGLETGDPVKIAGIKKGKVVNIDLHQNKALVTIAISKDVTLYSDLSAQIQSTELMGTEMISLSPGGNGRPLNLDLPQDPIIGTSSLTVGEMIVVLGELAKKTQNVITNLDQALTDFNKTLGRPETQAALRKSVNNLESTSEHLKQLVEENDQKVRSTILNIDEVSNSFKSLLVDRRDELDSTVTKFTDSVDKLSEFSISLNQMMIRINQGHGTIGKLLNDDGTFERIQSIANDLDSLSTDLKKNLGRYLAGANINLLNLIAF